MQSADIYNQSNHKQREWITAKEKSKSQLYTQKQRINTSVIK